MIWIKIFEIIWILFFKRVWILCFKMAFFLSQTDLNKICHNYLDPTLQTDLGLIFKKIWIPILPIFGVLLKKTIFLYILYCYFSDKRILYAISK